MAYQMVFTRQMDNTTFSKNSENYTHTLPWLYRATDWTRTGDTAISVGKVTSATFSSKWSAQQWKSAQQVRAHLSDTNGTILVSTAYQKLNFSSSNSVPTITHNFGAISQDVWARVTNVKLEYNGVSGMSEHLYYRGPFVLTVNFESAIDLSFYTGGAFKPVSQAQIYQNGAWVNVNDVIKYKSIATQVPVAALTSNSGPNGYSCGASSVYDSNYPAYLAFNKVNVSANGWVSAVNPTAPQSIWLNLPKAGYLKSVTVYNRNNTDVRGIIAASIQGRRVGESSYTTLVTKSDFPGSTINQGTTVTIPSTYENTLFDSIRLEITNWHMKDGSNHHICISEIVPEVIYPFGP